jgi:hypothetical protein
MYINFMSFKIFQISSQKPKVFAFDFTKKHQFLTKTDLNFVFLDSDAHIPDRLYIMVMYISFYGFKKIKF